MILVSEIESITEYCQANRPDKDSQIPYFIAIETDGGYELPNDHLIKKGLTELKIPFSMVEFIEGISVEIVVIEDLTG